MLPPTGLEPSVVSFFENATPTSILSIAIATASSILPGADMASSTSLIAVAATSAASIAFSEPNKPGSPGECHLLGPFAILIQGSLGLLALLALVFKRWRERPQRPVKIWFFDVSKQVVGSVLVHIANLLMSMLSSGQFTIKADPKVVTHLRRIIDANGNFQPNPCSFYLLNLAIDTTVGIPILIVLLRILTALFRKTPLGNPPESIESGNYGQPPNAVWWGKQSIIYFLGLLGMKICVLIVFLVAPWISRVGDWALRWTEGDEALQVIFVMLIFPVIMNATQYYIIDTFIKNQKVDHLHERIPDSDDDSESHPYEDPRGSGDEILLSDEDEAEVKVDPKSPSGSGKQPRRPRNLQAGKDYDPMFDGETSPTVIGSASTAGP